jgi:tetratricopeptide (TPR) repeat protein
MNNMNYKTRLLSINILLLGTLELFGQRSTAFSLISKPTSETSIGNFHLQEKFQKAELIYKRLVEARGDRRFNPPKFKMDSNERFAAYLESDGLSIGLEEKIYDLCMGLGEKEGEKAIAAILGHELTHFYEKHQWRTGFVNSFEGLKVADKLREGDLLYLIDCETQADYLGNFLAYSAGFEVFYDLPKFYDLLYESYKLPDTLMGYPEKEDRKKLALMTLEKTRELVEVFDVANLLTAIGNYEDARAFYKHILVQYQGREIYNNMGILTVLSALSYFSPEERKYRIPLELDLNFGSSSRQGFVSKEKIRRDLLQEAINYFDNAISMDSKYASAYLNKACAYFMLGGEDNLRRAKFYVDVEAREKIMLDSLNLSTTSHGVTILLALIAEKEGRLDHAKAMLETIKSSSAIANYNLSVMNKKVVTKVQTQNGPEDEEIEGIEHNQIISFTQNNRNKIKMQKLFGTIQLRTYKNLGELKSSKIFVYRPPSGEDSPDIYFHLSDTNYKGQTSDNFKIGTNRKAITDIYGEPRSLKVTNGEILIYEEMLFILDKNQQIKQFANYFKK